MDSVDNVIVLNDANGEECGFEFLDLVELDGTEYVVLLSVDDDSATTEVVILATEGPDEGDPETECYVSVDDERTLHRVFEILTSRFKDEFDFVDE